MPDALAPAVLAFLDGAPAPRALCTPPTAQAPRVAIIGGGFSGTLTAVHLLRLADAPLHIVIFDRAAAFAAGIAYRTTDARHLLNVPAARMSAFPDAPDHFRAWTDAAPGAFIPRATYAAYLRDLLLEAARGARPEVTLELRAADVASITAASTTTDARYTLTLTDATQLAASAVVLATGHRPPGDPLSGRWHGPRARFITQPWPTLPDDIAGDEPVVLLGTGLTAIDAVLTLTRGPRSAPIMAISRRGLLPRVHATAPAPLTPLAIDDAIAAGSTRALVRAIRDALPHATDWRSVIDALRPHSARIWQSLPVAEAAAFLRHVRPLWEVHRHRMAPAIAAIIDEHLRTRTLRIVAGRITAARATATSVELDVAVRNAAPTQLTTAWVINCTGPGATHAVAAPLDRLLAEGQLTADPLGQGVLSTDDGHAIAHGQPRRGLFVIGTLTKPRHWEATAVPELRQHAASVAAAVLADL